MVAQIYEYAPHLYAATSLLSSYYLNGPRQALAQRLFNSGLPALHVSDFEMTEIDIQLHLAHEKKRFDLEAIDKIRKKISTDLDAAILVKLSISTRDEETITSSTAQLLIEFGPSFDVTEGEFRHLATAKHFGLKRFLTFRPEQRRLAEELKFDTDLKSVGWFGFTDYDG